MFFCLWIKYLWNGLTDLCQIHREDMFGPSLGWILISRSKVKVSRDKKCSVHSCHPWQWQNGTCLLQITSCGNRWEHSVTARGWFWQLYRRFPVNHFPGQTFPGQNLSRTRPFPDNYFSGQTFPGQVILRNFHVHNVCKFQLYRPSDTIGIWSVY